MKFLPVLLAATLATNAAPADPGKAAIEFLEKVRHGKVDLEPGGDTAMSPQTEDAKRRQIAKQLERVARDLGSDPLEVGEVKTDENFAAVLVRKIGDFDPGRLQVFSVALVKKGNGWSAAPVPASFENSGAVYATALRQRLDALENWMLREQVVDLEKLRAQSAERMRRKIEVSLPAATLRGYRPEQVGQEFLAACRRRDLPAVLGFLGGLATEMPDDWAKRLNAAERAMATGNSAKPPWRMLVSPDVATVLTGVDREDDQWQISYVCLDPSGHGTGSGHFRMVTFGLAKAGDGLWRIDPPAGFLQGPGEPEDSSEIEEDQALAGKFPEKWMATQQPAPQPTAELANQGLIRAMQGGDLKDLLNLSALDGGRESALKACNQAADVWAALHDPGAVRDAIPLGFMAEEAVAVGLFQFFSARDPDRFDLKSCWFQKTPAGWKWSASPASEISGGMKDWVAAETTRWQDQWQQQLLGGVPVVKDFGDFPPPSAPEARACVEKWLDAANHGNLQAAISLFARLAAPTSSAKAFQNLSYEINGARVWQGPPVITGVHQGKIWTAVDVTISQNGGKSLRPVFPVIQTAQGPRLLAEIDLFADDNRSRSFLNNEALDRLRKSGTDAAADELKALLEESMAARQKAGDH